MISNKDKLHDQRYYIGDFVYIEQSPTSPFDICKIDELIRSETGSIDVKVQMYFRKRDIANQVLQAAEKQLFNVEEYCSQTNSILTASEKHMLTHREIFQTRITSLFPANIIRGKCSVTLFCDIMDPCYYLKHEHLFFYEFVYDEQLKNFTSDRSSIRVGPKYQVNMDLHECKSDDKIEARLMWTENSICSKTEVESFLTTIKSIGTYARALNVKSSVRHGSLKNSASAAARDITIQKGLDILHENNYSFNESLLHLIPKNKPSFFQDEFEGWSISECNAFETAMNKVGKDFYEIQREHLPWKSVKNIIEYYYMWKTSDRYIFQRCSKAVEKENQLKEVFIPDVNRPNPSLIIMGLNRSTDVDVDVPDCCSCHTSQSSQWYVFGPTHTKARVCLPCWTYWRRCGGLVNPSRLEKQGNMYQSRFFYKCTAPDCFEEFRSQVTLVEHQSQQHGISFMDIAALTEKNKPSNYLCKDVYSRRGNFLMQPFEWIKNVRKHSRHLLKTVARINVDRNSSKFSTLKNLSDYLINLNHSLNPKLNTIEKKAHYASLNVDMSVFYRKSISKSRIVLKRVNLKCLSPNRCSVYAPNNNICFKSTFKEKLIRKNIEKKLLIRLARSPNKRTFN
ncbi:Metastasis-associated protein MTA3 [Intoshia linei]|uniref:Metastasis-associated protein MTA3 n=1 Tax=Intoshia linei TaxID=1819745 RepID=A0A177B4K3_9BILA|nr:Metastasis-associated protein MTA3 [Intoshia linei]